MSRLLKGGDILEIKPLACPPLLHLAWSKWLNGDSKYLLAAASRTDHILFYTYDPKDSSLCLLKTLEIGSNIFCLYLDIRTLANTYELIVSSNDSKVIYLVLDY